MKRFYDNKQSIPFILVFVLLIVNASTSQQTAHQRFDDRFYRQWETQPQLYYLKNTPHNWQFTPFPDLHYELGPERMADLLHARPRDYRRSQRSFFRLPKKTNTGQSVILPQDFGFEEAWIRRFEEDQPGHDDVIMDVALDSLGNIYVTGESSNLYRGADCYTIKYDSLGNELWSHRFDGGGDDVPVSIDVDDSGYVYVFGETDGFSNSIDLLLLKYGSNGELLWQFTYDNTGNTDTYAFGSAITRGGTAYIAGSEDWRSPTEFVLLAIDHTGNQLWLDSNIPITQSWNKDRITCDQSGNVFITGHLWINGNAHIGTYKYDRFGNRLWENFYSAEEGELTEIIVTYSGYVYVAGTYNYNQSIILLKYDAAGNEMWARTFEDNDGSVWVEDLEIDRQGNAYLAGTRLLKYNAAGTLQWMVEESGEKVLTRKDGNLLLIKYDFETVLLDENGGIIWTKQLQSPPGEYRQVGASALDAADHLVMAGYSRTETSYNYSFLLVKSDAQSAELFRRQYTGPGVLRSYTRDLQINSYGDIHVLGSRSWYEKFILAYAPDGAERFHTDDLGAADEIGAEFLRAGPDGSVYVIGSAGISRMTPNGAVLWTRMYDEPGSSSYLQAATGLLGEIICAVSHYNRMSFELYCYEDSGVLRWKRKHQYVPQVDPDLEYYNLYIWNMQTDISGNLYILGQFNGQYYWYSFSEEFIIKFSASGMHEWTYTTDRAEFGYPDDLGLDADGNVYITGIMSGSSYRNTPGTLSLLKLDPQGVVRWSYTMQDISFYYHQSRIQIDRQGSAITVLLQYHRENRRNDIKVTKFTPWGIPEWSAIHEENSSVYPQQLILNQNGNIFIVGEAQDFIGTKDAGLVLKYTSDGVMQGLQHYTSQKYHQYFDYSAVDAWGNLYVANTSYGSSYSGGQIELIKYRPLHTAAAKSAASRLLTLEQNRPNPFNARTHIGFTLPETGPASLEIYDVRGRRIISENLGRLNDGSHTYEFNARALASGVYYYRIRQEAYSATRKMVILK